MAVYQCRRCGYESPTMYEAPCPSCKGFYRAKKLGVDTEEQKGRSSFAKSEEAKIVHIPTGVVGFDKTIGGGVVAGSCILIGGYRGAGKSSLLCMVADAMTRVRSGALYASSEESTKGVLRIANRLGFTNDDVEVLGNQLVIERVIEHSKKTRPFFSVYDSLQKFTSEHGGSDAVMEAIIRHHREANTVGCVVNQMTKGGEMKGDSGAAHDVDTVLVLAFPKDDDDEAPKHPETRMLCVDGKNRNGPGDSKTYWKLHGENDPHPGLLEHVSSRSRLVDESRRRYRKRDDEDEAN